MNTISLIDAALFSPTSLRNPNAWIGHLPFAAWVVREKMPGIFVELGTHSGNSYFSFCQAVHEAKLSTRCYAVDTWNGDVHAGFYGEDVFKQVKEHNQKYFAGFSQLLRMTFDEAASYFSEGSIDLLHIDGLHTYEATKHDFHTWFPKLAPGAVVILHDTNERANDFGVWRFWEELQKEYPMNIEFPHSHGIGVVQLNDAAAEKKMYWLDSNTPEKQTLRNYFSTLGSRQLERYELMTLRNRLVEREGEIHVLKQSEVEKDELIAAKNKEIKERSRQIERLNSALVERINSHDHAIAERDCQMNDLKRALEERDGDIASLKRSLSERDGRIISLQSLAQDLYNSTSWRVTAPLRFLGHMRHNAVPLGTMAKGLLQREDLVQLMKRALMVLRREGVHVLGGKIHSLYRSEKKELSVLDMAAPGLEDFKQASLVRSQAGQYALKNAPGAYTYIEPQRPENIEAKIASLKHPTRFSLVIPVYNTPAVLLESAVDSVIQQWYPHWQVVLADDASTSEETCSSLAGINHPKIKLVRSAINQGISGATNAAISAATGDFIVFMDHDDQITADCLYELALCIDREDPDFIYSDEDKINEKGEYAEPHFKPDWSPDTMMSTMFTGHVSCMRRSVVDQVGRLRSQFDGCQDWDLVLRLTEHTSRIAHIPKVLYHWRMISGSTAADLAAKPYVLEKSRRVRMDALERRGLIGSVEPVREVPGYFRVNYQMQGSPLISIIIPTRDNLRLLRRCLVSIQEKSTYRNFEIIILDNGSTDPPTLAFLKEEHDAGRVRVIRHGAPFNYSELNNIGAENARGDLLLFLNDDTQVLTGDWLERMAGYAQLPHIGAVGAKLVYPNGEAIQHAGILNLQSGPQHAFLHIGSQSPGYFMRNLLEYNWVAVTGACLMIQKSKFDCTGGFELSLPVAYNDVELCIRCLEKGLYNVVCQAVTLIHHESMTRGFDNADRGKIERLKNELDRLYDMHPFYFQYDPFHSPNLNPDGIHFEVAS